MEKENRVTSEKPSTGDSWPGQGKKFIVEVESKTYVSQQLFQRIRLNPSNKQTQAIPLVERPLIDWPEMILLFRFHSPFFGSTVLAAFPSHIWPPHHYDHGSMHQ